MKSPPIKPHWLDRAIEVYNYHVSQCKEVPGWTVEQTANSLCRSIGSVSQDIKIANWSRTHEKQIRRCGTVSEALQWIKGKERERMEEIK